MLRITVAALFLVTIFLLPTNASAQSFSCNGSGSGVIPGTPVTYNCGSSTPLPQPPPIPSTGCAPSQRSTPWNLTRQCYGYISYQPGAPVSGSQLTPYLADLLGGGAWLKYAGMSWAWYTQIATGSYVSFSFVPISSGALNFNANPTYGGGGVASVSAAPGVFAVSNGAVCVAANGGMNNLAVGGYNCPVTVGQTYYLNIASVTSTGTPSCWGIKPWLPQTCTASTVAYTAN